MSREPDPTAAGSIADLVETIESGRSVLLSSTNSAQRSTLVDAVLTDGRFRNRVVDRIDPHSDQWSRADLYWPGPARDLVAAMSRLLQRWTELSIDRHPVILAVEGTESLDPLTTHALRQAVAAHTVVLLATESVDDPVKGDIAALVAEQLMVRKAIEGTSDVVSLPALEERLARLTPDAMRLAHALSCVGILHRPFANRLQFGRAAAELELGGLASISDTGEISLASSTVRDHLQRQGDAVDCHRTLLDLIEEYDAHDLIENTTLVDWTQAAGRTVAPRQAVQAARTLLRNFESKRAIRVLADQQRTDEVNLLIGRAHLLLGDHGTGTSLVRAANETDSAAGVEAGLLLASYGLQRSLDIDLADRTLSRTDGLYGNNPDVRFERLALATRRAVIRGGFDDVVDRLSEHFVGRQICDRTELMLAVEGVGLLAANGLAEESGPLIAEIDTAWARLGLAPTDMPSAVAHLCLATFWIGDLVAATNRAERATEEAIVESQYEAIGPVGTTLAPLLRLGGRIDESIWMSRLTLDTLDDQVAPHRRALAQQNCIAALALAGVQNRSAEASSTSDRTTSTHDIVASGEALTSWQTDRLANPTVTMESLRQPLEALCANGKPLCTVTAAIELLLAPVESWLVDLLAETTKCMEQSCLAHPVAAYAAAAESADLNELERTAGIFESSGLIPLAWHAWAQAAKVCRTNDPARAFRAVVGAERCQATCRELAAPWTPTQPTLLTKQERRVAAWANGNESTKDLADRHHRSVRTINNHLHRIYRTLGISGRDELRTLMDRPTTPDYFMRR